MERIRRPSISRQQKSCCSFGGVAFRERSGRWVSGLPTRRELPGRDVPLIGYGTLDLIPKKVVKWLRILSTSACLTYEPVLRSMGRGRLKVLFTLSRIPLPRAGFR